MAYNHGFNYKGGTKRVRDSRRNKNIAKIVGWCLLWLFIGMLVAHIVFSVIANVSRKSEELEQQGIKPITSIQDEINTENISTVYFDGDLSDSFATDKFIAMMKKKDIKRVVLDVKPESGNIFYNTEVTLAKKIGALGEMPLNLEETVIKFKNADIKVAVRISLYIDNLYAISYPDKTARLVYKNEITEENPEEEKTENSEPPETEQTAETTFGEETWLDNESNAWISPYDTNYIEYVVELIRDLGNYDVDSIIIDNVRFPTVFEGNTGDVGFTDEEDSETPRSGIIQQNLQTIHTAANEAGMTMYTIIDAVFAAGEQDEVAGITFNVFDFSTDALCPVCIPSEISSDNIVSFGNYTFENAETAPIPELFSAMIGQIKIMQGALDHPPALCPLIQVYTDKNKSASNRRDFTPEDVLAEINALTENSINAKVYVGTVEEYQTLLPEAAITEE